MIPALADLNELPRQNASFVKNKWGDVVRQVHQSGSLAITNHANVEMVLLDAATYRRLSEDILALRTQEQSALDALNQRFDARLATLAHADTADKVASLFDAKGKRAQRPKAGSSF
jgi:prevent-host-death family protein